MFAARKSLEPWKKFKKGKVRSRCFFHGVPNVGRDESQQRQHPQWFSKMVPAGPICRDVKTNRRSILCS